MRHRSVDSDDVRLHVVEAGNPQNPAIVFLHGFPDCHEVWQEQMQALADEFHVIGFDMRGAGRSSRSRRTNRYRLTHMVADVAAVIDATRGPGGRVHLVGHDWGSVIGWHFIRRTEGRVRVASWTSMSGPDLDMLGDWARRKLTSGRRAEVSQALEQLWHSWYVFAFQVPGLATALFRFFGVNLWRRSLRAGGVPSGHPYLRVSAEDVRARTLEPIQLYAQNAFQSLRPSMPIRVRVPTQLLQLNRDLFVRPDVFDYLEDYVPDLVRIELDANHWAQLSHADAVSGSIRDFVRSQEAARQDSA